MDFVIEIDTRQTLSQHADPIAFAAGRDQIVFSALGKQAPNTVGGSFLAV